MNGYLLDSDIIIDFLRREKRIVDLVLSLVDKGTVGCSSLSIIEVIGGMKAGEERATYSFIEGLKIFPITKNIGILASDGQRKLRAKGITVGTVDSAQAAVCIANNLTLVSSNRKHYEHIESLKLL